MKSVLLIALSFFVSTQVKAQITEADFTYNQSHEYTISTFEVIPSLYQNPNNPLDQSTKLSFEIPVTSNIGIGTNGYLAVHVALMDKYQDEIFYRSACIDVEQNDFVTPLQIIKLSMNVPIGFVPENNLIQAYATTFMCLPAWANEYLVSNIHTQQFIPTEKTEISVKELKFAQVVYNPQSNPSGDQLSEYSPLTPIASTQFLAVQGKSASFSPTVVSLPAGQNVPPGKFKVQILNSANVIVSESNEIDNSVLNSVTEYNIPPDQMAPPSPMKAFIPTALGNQQYKAIVVSTTEAVKNIEKPFKINVLKTYAPTIGLVRITNSFAPTTSNLVFNNFLGLSPYLSAVLPVADKSISISDLGQIPGNPIASGAYFNDLLLIDRKARYTFTNRVVAIVEPGYLTSVGLNPDAIGGYSYATLPKASVALSTVLASLPHELGHSFGINYEMYAKSPRTLSNGYQGDISGYLNKISVFSLERSFMDSGRKSDSPTTMPWIDDRSYSILFNYMQKPIIDPETILVSGILNKNGSFSNLGTYPITNGVETISDSSGTITIKALDKNDNTLDSVSIKENFTRNLIPIEGSPQISNVAVDNIPIAVELAAVPGIVSIQVVHNEKVLLKKSLKGLNLVGIIDRIPLNAFKAIGCNKAQDIQKFAQKEKDALRFLALQSQTILDSKKPQGAKLTLAALILALKLTTKDKYFTDQLDELSPSNAIIEIKKIINSI